MINTIEIQTIDNCNSTCIFCPSRLMYRTGRVMSMALLDSILRQVKVAIETEKIIEKPTIIISAFSETFLDPSIFTKIEYIKNSVKCYLKVYSNGLLFHKYKSEIIESQIDELVYSNYGDNLKDFNTATGLNIDNKTFVDIKNAGNDIRERKNLVIWDAWQDGKLYDFSSRAGAVRKAQIKNEVTRCQWKRPTDFLYILENGDMVLCCMDWKRETLYGNINDNTLNYILDSERYKDLVAKTQGKKSDASFICKRCEVSI